jgi:chemotaxis signal transduction protein
LPATTRTSSPTPAGAKAYLVFVVGSEGYACSIQNIEHVLRRTDTPIEAGAGASLPSEIGRLAGRAGGVPIFSMHSLWGLPGEQPATEKEAILIVRLPGQSFGLLVQECRGVISDLPPEALRLPLPCVLRGTRGAAFETVVYWQKSLLVTVRLDKLLPSEFESLPASQPGMPPPL